MSAPSVELRPAWNNYAGNIVIGASCLLLAMVPGGAWGVPAVVWTVAAIGTGGFAVLHRYSWRFEIAGDRLSSHSGLINRRHCSIPVAEIGRIELHQPWGDRVFSVGTLAFFRHDAGDPDLVFWGIKHAAEWRDRIRTLLARAGDPGTGDETLPQR